MKDDVFEEAGCWENIRMKEETIGVGLNQGPMLDETSTWC